jgi:hypothetical protein
MRAYAKSPTRRARSLDVPDPKQESVSVPEGINKRNSKHGPVALRHVNRTQKARHHRLTAFTHERVDIAMMTRYENPAAEGATELPYGQYGSQPAVLAQDRTA